MREEPASATPTSWSQTGTSLHDEIRERVDNFLERREQARDGCGGRRRPHGRPRRDRRRGRPRRLDRADRALRRLPRPLGRPPRALGRRAARAGSPRASGRCDCREEGPGEIGELTRSFNEMADRIEQNRAELEQQNAELRESERMKTELVNIVSHELRTPLASVLGFTALLLKREFDPPRGATTSGSSTRRRAVSRRCSRTSSTSSGSSIRGSSSSTENDRPRHAARRAGAALRGAEPEAPARGGPRTSGRCPSAATRTGSRRWSATCSRMRSSTRRREAWSSWRRSGTTARCG